MPTDEDHMKTLKAFWLIVCMIIIFPLWLLMKAYSIPQKIERFFTVAEFAEMGTPFLYIVSWILWFQSYYAANMLFYYLLSQ